MGVGWRAVWIEEHQDCRAVGGRASLVSSECQDIPPPSIPDTLSLPRTFTSNHPTTHTAMQSVLVALVLGLFLLVGLGCVEQAYAQSDDQRQDQDHEDDLDVQRYTERVVDKAGRTQLWLDCQGEVVEVVARFLVWRESGQAAPFNLLVPDADGVMPWEVVQNHPTNTHLRPFVLNESLCQLIALGWYDVVAALMKRNPGVINLTRGCQSGVLPSWSPDDASKHLPVILRHLKGPPDDHFEPNAIR